MSKLVSAFAVLLVVIAVVLGGTMLAQGTKENFSSFLNANAQPGQLAASDETAANPQTITVSADFTTKATPTKAEIQFAVETTNLSAQTAQQQNAVLSQKVMDALKNAGITAPNIKTTSYSLQEKTRWDPKTMETVNEGYSAVNSIQVTVLDISQTGKIIDTAVEAGVNQVSNITFTVEDASLKSLKRDALTAAAQEAQAKANAIASGLNVQVDKVLSANENGLIIQPYRYQYEKVAMDSAGSAMAPTPIIPGDMEITANLTVTYSIK